MKNLIFFSILTFFLTGCGNQFSNNAIELDYNANGRTITMHPSQSLILDLIEDNTKGKGWTIYPYTAHVIGFISSRFEPDEKIEGAGGHRIIKFKALNYGTSKLKIIYHNTTNPRIKEFKNFEIIINVVKKEAEKKT